MGKDKLPLILKVNLFLCLVILLSWVGSSAWKERERLEKQHQEKVAQLEKEFKRDVQRAKRATALPCATVFYDFVKPPAGLGGEKRLVMFGEEVPSFVDPSAYRLRLNGGKMELWGIDVLGSRESKTIKFRKIGEKYNFDSKFCREREHHHGGGSEF